MIDLHWKEGKLSVIGVEPGYRYLLGQGPIKKGYVPPKKIVANEFKESGMLHPIELPLKVGWFIFRARHKYGPNYEFIGSTGRLPVRVLSEKHYEQIESVEGLDEYPDPREIIVRR